MGVVLDLIGPEIEKTIKRLDTMRFDPDPIAGPHFSKITSVMSSAYKRHGYILERAILESLRLCPDFEVWHDPIFQVPSAEWRCGANRAARCQMPRRDAPAPRTAPAPVPVRFGSGGANGRKVRPTPAI